MGDITFPVIVQGGLVLLASTTWSETGRAILTGYYGERATNAAQLLYATFVTVVVIIVIMLLHRATGAAKDAYTKNNQTIGQVASAFRPTRVGGSNA
jgi:uncharacterized membrane protein